MKWIRRGRICGNDTWDLPWHKRNTQMPVPFLLDDGRLRLYLTLCDEENRGRLGYVDVDPDDPGRILDYSRKPLLDTGQRGRFDENGVVTTCILQEGDQMLAYYCGFQKHVNYPYSSLAGVAVSNDGGETFLRVRQTPLLERREGEMFIRTGAGVQKMPDGWYRLYYAAGDSWFEEGGKWYPQYSLRCIQSRSPDRFEGNSVEVFPAEGDEFGITSPQIVKYAGIWRMIYSVRSRQYGYRMGYAESEDGIRFARRDYVMEMDRPSGSFDSEMICYGKCFEYKGRICLFYSGNHYGMGGIGKMNNYQKVRMLEFKSIGDERGSLVVCEGGEDIPFIAKRLFYIFGSDGSVIRGRHANRRSEFVLVNAAGSSRVRTRDGCGNESVYLLDRPCAGIYIPSMVWKEMYDFSQDSVLLCLSSEHYDADEYIRDYEEYAREMERMCGG